MPRVHERVDPLDGLQAPAGYKVRGHWQLVASSTPIRSESFFCLSDQPLAVVLREVIVSDQAPFQEGNPGGPLTEFAGCGVDGETEGGARLPEVAVGWRRLGFGNLAVDFPGGVAFVQRNISPAGCLA